MTRASEIVAVLDANVLYPMPLCDTLLSLAEGSPISDPYLPRWSVDILEEVRRNLVADGRCTPSQALRRIQLMNDAFPEASVAGYESLIPNLRNDMDDRHVLAAAIRGNAEYIVTQNVRHFPTSAIEPFGIRVVTADTFLLNFCMDWNSQASLGNTILRQAQSLQRPQLTPRQVLHALAHHIPETCKLIEGYLEHSDPYALDRFRNSGPQ
jgi:predicted nucleic acid-binding protein